MHVSYPLKVEEVFFQGLSSLRLLALVDDIGILFVATALVILAAVSLPISQTHPAEIYTHTYPLFKLRVLHVRAGFIWLHAQQLGSYRAYTWSIAT